MSKYTKTIGRSGGKQASTALAGVREKQAVSDDIEWFKEDAGETETLSALQKGKDLFNEGRYVQAIPVFTDLTGEESAGDEGSGSTLKRSIRHEGAFYLGVSLFNVLRYREALPYLKESLADRSADYYEPALFHYAFTFHMLERYEEAIEDFKRCREEFEGGSLEPYVILMRRKSCRKIGNPREARSYFLEIERKYGGSDVSSYASEELK